MTVAEPTPQGPGADELLRKKTSITKSILLALVYLPILFFLWYFCSPLIAFIVSLVMEPAARWLSSGTLAELNYQDVLVQATILLHPGTYGDLVVPPRQVAEIFISARPMVYGYSVPLFFTLLFAFSARPVSTRAKIVALVFLLLGICLGTLMELLKTVYFSLDPALVQGGSLSQWQATLLALCYQLSTLILPAVLPIGLWLALSGQEFIEQALAAKKALE